MSEQCVNPYEPVQPGAQDGPIEPLRFKGVIERADYQRMLPRWERERVLCLVLAVLLGTCILLFGPLSLLFALSEGRLLPVLGLTIFWALTIAGLWFLKTRVSASNRATRLLKIYPDVLGTAQGAFTDGGLSFHDGVHTYWFGPPYLLRTFICADGMRVHVDASAYHYLALPARIFDDFHIDTVNRLKRRWRILATTPTAIENPPGIELWNRISQPPANAIHFSGWAESQIQLRTPAYRNRALIESGSLMIAGFIVFIARHQLQTWIFSTGVLLVSFWLVVNVLNWWNYYRRIYKQSWYQSGWISSTELAFHYSNLGVRMPLSQIVHKADYPDLVLLTVSSRSSYSILRPMVANDDDWQRLVALKLAL